MVIFACNLILKARTTLLLPSFLALFERPKLPITLPALANELANEWVLACFVESVLVSFNRPLRCVELRPVDLYPFR